MFVLLHVLCVQLDINPLHTTSLFLYPQKTSENLWFVDNFRWYRRDQSYGKACCSFFCRWKLFLFIASFILHEVLLVNDIRIIWWVISGCKTLLLRLINNEFWFLVKILFYFLFLFLIAISLCDRVKKKTNWK